MDMDMDMDMDMSTLEQRFQELTERKELAEKITLLKKEIEELISSTNAQLAQLVQELTEESTRLKKELTSFKEKTDKKQKEIEEFQKKTEEKFTLVEQSLQGIRAAFAPATKCALMETAIYTFVEVGLRKYGSVDKIQYPASKLASCVLTLLLLEDVSESNFVWRGPKNSQIGNDGYNDGLFVVGLQVLGALVAFIENEHTSQADLQDWPPERNVVAHNVKLLDALHEGGAPVVAKTAAQIEVMRADFGEKSKETIRPQPERWEAQLGEELDKVVKALEKKDLAPNALGKKAALKVLENICSPDHP
jgi:hypothetical protein